MEIDKLIVELNDFAEDLKGEEVPYYYGVELVRKAAEVIRLQNECISDGYNERWHRMIDDMEG